MQSTAGPDYKKQLRREMTVLCLIFMLYMVVIGFVNGFFSLFSDTAAYGFGSGESDEAMMRLDMMVYLGTYIFMFAVPLGIFFIVKSKERTTDYLYVNHGPKIGVTLLGCVGVLAINYVFTILSDAGEVILSRIGLLSTGMGLPQIGNDPVCNGIYFVILVIAPALLEEFCFRGVICGRLAKFNRTAAVILSSVLFSLMHMTVSQIPFALAAGLLIGYVYVRTGSIWSCVLIHAVNNGFAYVSEYVYYLHDGAMTMQRLYMVIWAAIFIVGFACLVILGLSHEDTGQPQLLTGKQAVAAAASSPLFIVCCALALAATVLTVPLL